MSMRGSVVAFMSFSFSVHRNPRRGIAPRAVG
jgi:hypothetical protein